MSVSAIELHPTTVYKNGVLVGTGLWSDSSDATSVTLTRSNTTNQNATGSIPLLDLAAIPGGADSIIQLRFHMRVSATATSGSLTSLSPQITFGPGTDLIAYTDVSADGTIVDIQHSVTDADYANLGLGITDVAERLAGGSGGYAGPRSIRFVQNDGETVRPAGVTWTVTIYEAWLEVFYRTLTVAPPCQIYPRDDGQGVGSAAVWPPPSSNRPGSYY